MTAAEPQRDLVHLLSMAEHRAVRRQSALLEAEAEGCSIEQWRVLNLLADGLGHTMTEVAEYALLPAPTATKLIDRLVTDNLVYRHPDPADRRRVLVHAAQRGRELHARLAPSLARMQSEVLRPIGTGEELEALLDHLARVLDPGSARAGQVVA
ncbi:transcriptional regulator, MarR family [Catenulispora acidiphila DSM 44928]|uniref:Transcriptional regulator, MarR family n=1 Tax=Catenulispora acidiphila (strain DSM 44928 / JCM 14897 / NBRC 102108 / NRRL B-24433 / ID139908) TaxID=479433 RepID=C7PWK8_CATAD|nr:MarR family transcriptional regulator [Catenulispora acidiphila]ACU75288.1 transcriptional regulator, MarR family [Catenulispora acidiphila DSM 44928]